MTENKRVLLKVRDFAVRISASPTKVYQGIADGSIPSVKVCGMLRIPAAFADDLAKRAMAPEADDDAR
jgi:hypothetical protein